MEQRRFDDGSAGDANYGLIGSSYARYRQPEPLIEQYVWDALGTARTILNVGAGAGSYEPRDREVTAVEPSATMRAQRPPDLTQAIDAVAESLPFDDQSFDASMASSTIHQWTDLAAGIAELKRVTRGPIVLLVADPDRLLDYWLTEYFPEAIHIESSRFPRISTVVSLLGPETRVEVVPIPLNCVDGFSEAYYGRPERLLERGVQGAMSSWTKADPAALQRFEEHLMRDLASGEWDRKFGYLRSQPEYLGSLRLIVRP